MKNKNQSIKFTEKKTIKIQRRNQSLETSQGNRQHFKHQEYCFFLLAQFTVGSAKIPGLSSTNAFICGFANESKHWHLDATSTSLRLSSPSALSHHWATISGLQEKMGSRDKRIIWKCGACYLGHMQGKDDKRKQSGKMRITPKSCLLTFPCMT